MRKIGNQLVPLFVALVVVVLPSACRDATDLAETTSQDAEMTAAELEALELEALWLQMPGNDREFNRLLVEELRTGVPMDWDEALRALEADGWRFPAMTRLTGAPLPASVASASDREMYRDIVRDPAYYGSERYYLDAVVALSVLRGQQRAACHGVRQARSRVAWRDDDGRERVSRYESWVGRSCLDRSS